MYRTRFKVRGAFGGHDSENFVIFQVSSLTDVYTLFYAKFHGEFRNSHFNTNREAESISSSFLAPRVKITSRDYFLST